MSLLFHYTGAAGVSGILSEGNFRATDYRFLNDYREGTMLDEKIREAYRRRFLDFYEANKSKWNTEPIIKEFGSVEKLAEQEAATFKRVLFEIHRRISPTYVCSFCQHENDTEINNGLLSQWRGYGSGGGYCLVFDKSELEQLLKAEAKVSQGCAISGGTVDYTDDLHDEHVSKFDEIFERLIPAGLHRSRNFQKIVGELYPLMVSLVPFAKDGGFLEENEYRVVLSVMDVGPTENGNTNLRNMQFRESMGVLVPYVSVFSESMSLPLVRIIVGPSSNSQRRQLGIEKLLENLGLSVEVTVSEIPYLG